MPQRALNPSLFIQQVWPILALIGLGIIIGGLPFDTLALLGGAVGLVVLLRYPILSLYLLILIIPFSSLIAISLGSFKIGLMEIVLGAGILGGLWQRVRSGVGGRGSGNRSFFYPFLIFFSGISLSWLNALSIGASLIETAKWLEMLILYLLMIELLPRQQLPQVVLVILLTGAAQAILGIYQFIFKVGPAGFLLFDGLFMRSYGTFAQPNPYAGYLGLILPLALAIALSGTTKQACQNSILTSENRIFALLKQNYLLPVAYGTLPLLWVALFATQSRSGWIAAFVAMLVVLIILSRSAKIIFGTTGLFAMMAVLAGSFNFDVTFINSGSGIYQIILQRLVEAMSIFSIDDLARIELTDANFATLERLAHWQAAWTMWRDNFWLGVGFGNYEAVYPVYAIGLWQNPLGHAHNYLFNLGAEIGFIGLVSYVICWALIFAITWQTIKHSHGFERAVAVGGLGILVHLHIHNLFDNLYVQGMYLHVAIILALISVASSSCKVAQNGDLG